MAFYLHVGPFSREVIGRLENVMATLDATRIKAFDVTVRDIKPVGKNARNKRRLADVSQARNFIL
jgi:hypothetical protein